MIQPVKVMAHADDKTTLSLFDVAVYLLLCGLGALQFWLYPRVNDFIYDSTYFELAQSLIEKGSYGYSVRPETMLPPGFAVIVAAISLCVGHAYSVLIRSMAVFATLFTITAYELLRRQIDRWPAAGISLLLGSSPWLFSFSTHFLFSDLPYAFTSTLALLIAIQIDSIGNFTSRSLLCLCLVVSVAGSVLLRSAAIPLLGAIAACLATSFVFTREMSLVKLKLLFPALAIGILIQTGWMVWAARNEKPVWPMGGYPGSYLAQFKLKSGNNPELGEASTIDIAQRVRDNAAARIAALIQLLLRSSPTWIDAAWHSPLVFGTAVLLVLGLGVSDWRQASGLLQWYFVLHELMYLLWPWNLEVRFLLPVVPLACLYVWRGACALCGLLKDHFQITTICITMLATTMAIYPSYLAIYEHHGTKSVVLWLVLAGCFGSAAYSHIVRRILAILLSRRVALSVAMSSLVIGFIALGVCMQVQAGLDNVHFDLKQHAFYPDIEAAQWLRQHSAVDAVVMARKEDLVYHYSRRKVVWFPPSSNPMLLMDGIRKYHIEWVVVVDRKDSYFLPADDNCFASLASHDPAAFQLVHHGPNVRIVKVRSISDQLTDGQ